MEKKECLCEDGKATHEVFFKKFLEDVLNESHTAEERIQAVAAVGHLREYEELTSRDLENILNYVVNGEETVPDYGTIQWIACSCLRNKWEEVDDGKGGTDDTYVEGPECTVHLGCMISGEPNDFVAYVTDDSC